MISRLVVRQHGAKDCGAASLLSIIRYYKGNVSLEKLRIETNTTNIGTTFFHLLKCARNYGFEGMGLMSEIKALQHGEVKLPVIAHLQLFNQMTHFVVIYKISRKNVTIMDPGKGIVKLKIDDFITMWSKRILILYPIHPLLQIKDKKISYIFSNILPVEKKLIIQLFITSICLAIMNIITSFYFKIQVDQIGKGSEYKNIFFIFIVFLIMLVIKQIISIIRNTLEIYLNKNLDIRLIIPFIKHIFLLPLNIIKSKSTGEIMSRINDLNDLKSLFSNILITVVVDLLLVMAAILVLISVSSKLFWFLCLILISYIIVGLIFSPIIYKKVMESIDIETELNADLTEKINNLATIKNIHNLSFVFKNIEDRYLGYLKNSFKFTRFTKYYDFGKNSLEEIGLFLLSSLGLFMIYKNNLDFVDLVTFNSLLIYLFEPIKNIVKLIPSYSHLKIILEKVKDFYDIEEEETNQEFERFNNGKIVLTNVSYSYNSYSMVLNNINMTVEMGEKIFLKGYSGCGKSTICKIIYRLYEVDKGSIEIDDINIKDYKLNTIRSNIVYLGQNEEMFSMTIKENILYGRQVSLKGLQEIVDITRVNEIINKKNLRFDSLILDGGFNLSGGEKQRIVLARALLKRASILILDEALSEVSADMESQIIKDILKKFKNTTIIYVSHRNHEKLFDRVIDVGELNGY